MSVSARRFAPPKPFVLAHGSWHGGWCWRWVAQRLRAAGHLVFTPSFTGMGDRAHLLHADITLDTFIDDLVHVIESEELDDVVLVAHSYGGVPACGVADRIAGRLDQVVFLDALLVDAGETAFDAYPPDSAAARRQEAEAAGGLAVPVPETVPPVWGLEPASPEHAWVKRRMTPQPLGAYTTPLRLDRPLGNGLRSTYVHCHAPSHAVLDRSRALARKLVNETAHWAWRDLAAPHDAMLTHPDDVAALLCALATRRTDH